MNLGLLGGLGGLAQGVNNNIEWDRKQQEERARELFRQRLEDQIYTRNRADALADRADNRAYDQSQEARRWGREDQTYQRNRGDALADRADNRVYDQSQEARRWDRKQQEQRGRQEVDPRIEVMQERYKSLADIVANSMDSKTRASAQNEMDAVKASMDALMGFGGGTGGGAGGANSGADKQSNAGSYIQQTLAGRPKEKETTPEDRAKKDAEDLVSKGVFLNMDQAAARQTLDKYRHYMSDDLIRQAEAQIIVGGPNNKKPWAQYGR
jgi:hypothetical protein